MSRARQYGLVTAGILLLAAAAWLTRPDEPQPRGVDARKASEVSNYPAERAESALLLVSDVRAGRERSMSLTGEDLTAIVRHAVTGVVPAGIVDPEVRIEDGVVYVSADLVHAEFPAAEELGALASVMPDTAAVAVAGRIGAAPGGWIAFRIHAATIGGVPVPKAVLAAVVRRLPMGGAGAELGHEWIRKNHLARPALRARRPDGLGPMYVVGNRLFVESAEPFAAAAVDEDSP